MPHRMSNVEIDQSIRTEYAMLSTAYRDRTITPQLIGIINAELQIRIQDLIQERRLPPVQTVVEYDTLTGDLSLDWYRLPMQAESPPPSIALSTVESITTYLEPAVAGIFANYPDWRVNLIVRNRLIADLNAEVSLATQRGAIVPCNIFVRRPYEDLDLYERYWYVRVLQDRSVSMWGNITVPAPPNYARDLEMARHASAAIENMNEGTRAHLVAGGPVPVGVNLDILTASEMHTRTENLRHLAGDHGYTSGPGTRIYGTSGVIHGDDVPNGDMTFTLEAPAYEPGDPVSSIRFGQIRSRPFDRVLEEFQGEIIRVGRAEANE